MGGTIIIPARYASSRLPGKPLLKFAGRSLVEHTWRAACRSGLDVLIATDDERIMDEAARFGARAVMTGQCRNGTERCAAVAERLGLTGPIVNWQGDAPLISPDWPHALLEALRAGNPTATPVQLCTAEQARMLRGQFVSGRPGGTTAAMGCDFRALYFSKAPVPHGGAIWLHIGLYAYTADALALYAALRPGLLEQAEGLEQLRFLENGLPIQCLPVTGKPVWEVNRMEDIRIVERMMEERGETLRT